MRHPQLLAAVARLEVDDGFDGAAPPALCVLADVEWLTAEELEIASPFRLLEIDERRKAKSPLTTLTLGHLSPRSDAFGSSEAAQQIARE